jgi:hypothetical protein
VHRLRPGDRRGRRAALAGALQHWLLVRGRGDEPLPARGFTLERHSSTRRPTVQRGDRAICYASVWQAVFAVVEVVSDPEEDPGRSRWRWSFGLRPVVALNDLDQAIACEEVGVFPSSLWRHSYIRLSVEQFERAREAIATRAGGAGARRERAGEQRPRAR